MRLVFFVEKSFGAFDVSRPLRIMHGNPSELHENPSELHTAYRPGVRLRLRTEKLRHAKIIALRADGQLIIEILDPTMEGKYDEVLLFNGNSVIYSIALEEMKNLRSYLNLMDSIGSHCY